jgi:hypothetical protein
VIKARRLIDNLIEATVVLSFTDLGPMIRARLFDWEDLDRLDLAGRVIAITGANSGLGLGAAHRLGRMGAALRLLVRDEARGRRARESIRRAAPDADVVVYQVDLSDLASVRRTVEALHDREERLDVLVNNAGALLTQRGTSTDGYEMSFATMVLGPFVLTNGLVPILERTAEHAGVARVVNVVSGGMYCNAWTTCRWSASCTGGASPTRGRSGRWSPSPASGPEGCGAGPSRSTRCTPDGPTPRASSARSRRSTG